MHNVQYQQRKVDTSSEQTDILSTVCMKTNPLQGSIYFLHEIAISLKMLIKAQY